MSRYLTQIVCCVFLLVIFRSMYTMYLMFVNPNCEANEVCYKYYLNSNPKLDLFVFTSDNSRSGNFDLVLKKEDFKYLEPFEREIQVDLSKTVRNNGSLFIHSVIVPSKQRGKHLHFEDLLNEPDLTYLKTRLTSYALPAAAAFNLLRETNKQSNFKPVTHLQTKYSINLCIDITELPHSHIPMEIIRLIRVNKHNQLLPIAHIDRMQMRTKNLVELQKDSLTSKVLFVFTPNTLGKIRFLSQIEEALSHFIDLGFTDKDIDEVKGVLADTNLYLLCTTIFIGSIHLLLDFLTFKNDISFWRCQNSMAGLSTITVIWRCFSQNVIFLFLLDEGTSYLVLVPSGIACLIEAWKVCKMLKGSVRLTGLKWKKVEQTAEEKQTLEYETECIKYLSYVLYPLLVLAAIYSLLYQPHKSWYSWTINSLVNAVYAFGFLFMLPQLFINYRLKSVAALPWRAFTYRAFNTFIDDIFAFIITMPTAHRVACFRDDLVFLVYLYQRYLYPVDKTRTEDDSSKQKTQ